MGKRMIRVLILCCLVALVLPGATAAAEPLIPVRPVVTHFSVAGQPFHLAMGAPGKVWFTLPARGSIGLLDTTGGSAVTHEYVVGGEPYDLFYTSSALWFTDRTGSRIGRLDPANPSQTPDWFPLTAGRQPTGLAVYAVGGQAQVWFVERAGNKLGRLLTNGTLGGLVTEFDLPAGNDGAQLEDIYLRDGSNAWFTAPVSGKLGWFDPANPADMLMVSTGGGTAGSPQPWALHTDAAGNPWFTDRAGGRLGYYYPQTNATLAWIKLPGTGRRPLGLDIDASGIWYVDQGVNRLGRVDPVSKTVSEFTLPGSGPTDIVSDGLGCAFVAENAKTSIARWCAPYGYRIHLPVLAK